MEKNYLYCLLRPEKEHSLDQQLALLAEITQSFASSLHIDETLQNAMGRFMQYLDAEAVSIFLLENENRELVCHACAGPVDVSGLRLDSTQGIAGHCVATKQSKIVRDVLKDAHFAASVDAGTGFQTRSILCAPLIVNDVCIGVLELLNKKGGDGLFDERDKNLLTALASAAALSINNARMATALVEQERVQKELELAREIQERLLPSNDLEGFPVSGMNVPAREVSGDFFDFFELDDGRIYFNLADVSGKGINAALLMAKTSSLLRCLAKTHSDPGELLNLVNKEVCETVSHGMFVTIVSGFIEPEAGVIRLANAGHQPPLYHHPSGEFEEIPAEMPPLGILSDLEYPVVTLKLDGGRLYLFTDGVTESLINENQMLNVSGLIDLIKTMSELSSRQCLENIITEIRRPGLRQSDDITLMVIECDNTIKERQHEPRQLLELHFEARPDYLGDLRAQVRAATQQLGCSDQVISELVLAVNEACMNIMQHAYEGDCSGKIVLEIVGSPSEVEFILTDYACPADTDCIKPRDLDDIRPGGLGTHFMQSIMDSCDYGHLENRPGNYVRMKRKLGGV